MAACLRFTRRVFQDHLSVKGHDFNTLSSLTITAARPGRVEGFLDITSISQNRSGIVHGGVLASLTDTIGSLALSSHGLWSSGVSTDMSTSCLRSGGTVGEQLFVVGEVLSRGRTLGCARIEVLNAAGKIVAHGMHTKYLAKASSERDVRFSPDGEHELDA